MLRAVRSIAIAVAGPVQASAVLIGVDRRDRRGGGGIRREALTQDKRPAGFSAAPSCEHRAHPAD
jgi:hypothetical protein